MKVSEYVVVVVVMMMMMITQKCLCSSLALQVG